MVGSIFCLLVLFVKDLPGEIRVSFLRKMTVF